jgi:hypothetical protein
MAPSKKYLGRVRTFLEGVKTSLQDPKKMEEMKETLLRLGIIFMRLVRYLDDAKDKDLITIIKNILQKATSLKDVSQGLSQSIQTEFLNGTLHMNGLLQVLDKKGGKRRTKRNKKGTKRTKSQRKYSKMSFYGGGNTQRKTGKSCNYKGGEGNECSICYDDFSNENPLVVLHNINNVEHKFHSECIQRWIQITAECPICRYNLLNVDFDPDSITHQPLRTLVQERRIPAELRRQGNAVQVPNGVIMNTGVTLIGIIMTTIIGIHIDPTNSPHMIILICMLAVLVSDTITRIDTVERTTRRLHNEHDDGNEH